jgi:hypothetical protein
MSARAAGSVSSFARAGEPCTPDKGRINCSPGTPVQSSLAEGTTRVVPSPGIRKLRRSVFWECEVVSWVGASSKLRDQRDFHEIHNPIAQEHREL